EMSFLRRVAGLSLRDRVRSSDIRGELGVESLLLRVERSQLRWFGHLVRMPPGRLPLEVFRARPTGGPADGRLVAGDQLVKINNIAVDDLTPEQAAEIIRSTPSARSGPKSSFITPEKRAKLRSNPVKVHFAEEVEVNGHSQGNSLLFLPNVLKVYLENGQTKAFKFDTSTTVKDIVMTLKEKLPLSHIEHFSLVLEQRHSISKLLLLHEEERIQQVVQKKEAHDYRCLFRVCFMPKTLPMLLQEDPKAFEYLYLQGVNDVLQERFAIEMRCNTALQLAALHIQERLASCGQSPKTNLKMITKTWGIENFVSSTLLRNMREKDLRKAISYHMKKSQSQNDPKQKGLSADQTRINYLEELSNLKSFGGKSFSATMMLQDRESMVTLLVGARYGVSQVVNHKLSILSTLTEFTSITRIELLPESDKVSLVKIYLQDIKPITLLLESTAAKDMSCLIAGYCRVFVDPNLNIFPWIHDSKKHRVSAEEGYVSRCGSDSDTSSDLDMEALVTLVSHHERPCHRVRSSSDPEGRKRKDRNRKRNKDAAEEQPSVSEASDSCNTDSRVITSPSSDSLDALEEDDLISCSSSSIHFTAPLTIHSERGSINTDSSFKEHPLSPSPSSHIDFVFNFDQSDARCYYKLCSNITPDSARSLAHPLHHNEGEHWKEVEEDLAKAVDLEPIPILQPPPGFGDSSSDEEFFDARDRFTSPEDSTSGAMPRDADKHGKEEEGRKVGDEEGGGRETLFQLRKRSRKRRSFMETDYTSRVSYPEPDPDMQDLVSSSSDPEPSEQTQNPSPTVSSLTHSEGEPSQLESNLGSHDPQATSRTRKQEMEMEPDAMESKSVTDLVKAASPTITVVRCRVDPDGKESADRRGDGKEEGEEQKEMSEGEEEETAGVSGKGTFTNHMFLPESTEEEGKGEEEKKEGVRGNSSSSKRPLIGAERQPEANTLPTCLIDVTKKTSNGLLGDHLIALEQNLYIEEQMLDGVCEKSNPPYSPPPSSPLPPIPVLHKSQSDYYLMGEVGSENTGTSTKMSSSYSEEMSQRYTNRAQLHLDVTTSIIEDDANVVVSSTMTNSDEVTDSTNSDNVFFDDDLSNSLTPSSSDKKDECAVATRHSISATLAPASEGESQIIIKSPANIEAHTRISSVNSDYTRAINSITAKLGVATSATSPTFNSGTSLRVEVSHESASGLNQNVDKPISDSTMQSAEAKNSLAGPSLAKATTVTIHNLSKTPPSPTHFLFQTCSPSIMGSLSASTLRGKIQRLPLYLSRSLETLNQAGVGNVPQSSVEDKSRDEVKVTIKVTDVDDITQTIDFETGTTAESVESDDSDTTVTGSEVDGEFVVETNSAKSFQSVSEVKEVSPPLPVQTEPKPQHQHLHLYTGPIKNTSGPITDPPASRVSSLQRDSSGLHMETPGPIKDAPESKMKVTSPGEDFPGYKMNYQLRSIAHPIVVTTQNLNGPVLPFHSQAQKVRRTSSDRPLIGLCRPTVNNSDSPKTLSSGCRVFTICEDPAQTKSPAMVGTTPPLKSDFGCTSVLASGCESVVEGVQVPLDACGCPTVYTNCFSSGDSFDEELTVYEFSCRTESSDVTQTSGAGLPLMTSPPISSFLSTSSTHSPSFPRSNIFSSSTSELSPLLSPLSDSSDRFLPQTHKDTISRLGQQRYPEPPTGFQVLRIDVDQLLSILESTGADRSVAGHGGRHPRDTCPAHFTENKRVLQIEARRLMSGCQKVVGIGQSPEEMLHSLADSFRTLVELAGICLWFSGCERCDRRNAEAVAGLADVARSFRDFCLAAERASSKRSCQDLSSKLLAKQCTALTASVFCLTQLFRTLTAL
uniref:FERM and PDZ domain containing 1 n=1 Tax=Cyclopterus lumpus TaxID=8103 RepID=A0A8C2WVQ0_CYCLU